MSEGRLGGSGGSTVVAVLGTGIMGAPMARRLLAGGHQVRAWNRSREKAEPLAADGATVAGSPAEAAEGADVLLTMLADGGAVEQVVGDAAARPGTLWLQMSTVGIAATERLSGLAGDLVFVDAPVLGTREPAERGQLTVLASGPDQARER